MLLDSVKNHGASLSDPPPKVIVENLGAATVDLKILFWIDAEKNDLLSVRSSVMRQAKRALVENQISLPDEAREVIFPNGIPVQIQEDETKIASDGRMAHSPSSLVDAGELHVSEQGEAENLEDEYSEAEGNMLSETADLKKQADEAWNPDEGQDILLS